MKHFPIILLILGASAPATAADVLSVDWANKDLTAAREARVDLLSNENGFEGSGASELADIKLPVVGVLPSALSAVFAPTSSGFESAPRVPRNFRESKLKLVASALPSKLEYSITYQNIADGLDAYCVGTRSVSASPVPLPAGSNAIPSEQAENDDEIHAAHAQQMRYGLPYRCDVYCSDPKTYPYCKNNSFATKMLSRAVLLAPGVRD